jgi:hypothetical protein
MVAVNVAVGDVVFVIVTVWVRVLVRTRGVRLGVDVAGVPEVVIVGVTVVCPKSGARLNAINPRQ